MTWCVLTASEKELDRLLLGPMMDCGDDWLLHPIALTLLPTIPSRKGGAMGAPAVVDTGRMQLWCWGVTGDFLDPLWLLRTLIDPFCSSLPAEASCSVGGIKEASEFGARGDSNCEASLLELISSTNYSKFQRMSQRTEVAGRLDSS